MAQWKQHKTLHVPQIGWSSGCGQTMRTKFECSVDVSLLLRHVHPRSLFNINTAYCLLTDSPIPVLNLVQLSTWKAEVQAAKLYAILSAFCMKYTPSCNSLADSRICDFPSTARRRIYRTIQWTPAPPEARIWAPSGIPKHWHAKSKACAF